MAYKVFEDISAPQDSKGAHALVMNIEGPRLELPDASFIRDAEISRDGQDLVLRGPEGEITVRDYFSHAEPPLLFSPDGNALTPDLVQSFIKTDARFADATAGGATDVSPVGAVKEISGEATVTRANGKVETLGVGSPIYQGDIIETSEEGAVNIVFIDESTFAVSNDARMAIDQYVFDPSTSGGKTNFSVLKGVFVFTSGLIGREDPDDVEIQTPAGSIGIRGTIIVGNVDTGEITVVEGAIVLEDHNGNSLTLSSEFETAIFQPSEGKIELVGQLSAKDVSDRYENIANVATSLFSTIGESAEREGNKSQAEEKAGEDKESLLDDGNILSDDIVVATSNVQNLAADLVAQQFEIRPAGPAGNTYAPPPPPVQEPGPVTPPLGVQVERFSFAENDVSGVAVARLSAQFVNFADINLFGVSRNYFNIVRETPTTFLVSLKPGMAMNFEQAQKLQYVASDAKGNVIADISTLLVQNINEPTILTNAEPNTIGGSNYFAASNGNTWTYDFRQAFADPENDIANFNVLTPPSAGPGIASYSFNTTTGIMTIVFDGTVDGSNYAFTVQARDASNAVLNSTTINFDTIVQDEFSGFMISNNETFSSTGLVNDTVVIASNGNNVFTDAGADTISIAGSNNNIMAGSGNDNITVTSGTTNFIHGGSGGDQFTLDVMQGIKVYGGDDSDLFVLNTTAAVTHLQTFATGLTIDGGKDNHSNTNDGDVLRLTAAAGNIDFSLINNSIIKNIETIKTDNGAATIINLDYASVLAMTDERNTLYIDTDTNDTLNFTNGSGNVFFNTGTASNNGQTYNVYTDGIITLMVDTQAATVTGL